MNQIRSFIPNLLTLANLLCGCIALVFAFQWKLEYASYFIFLGAFFDFLDGFAARLLKVSGELGKQLDSLSDLVTFGVVPGIILMHLLHLSSIINSDMLRLGDDVMRLDLQQNYLPWIGLLIPLFSSYRLAKFNIDTRQSDSFIGLPTPANAIFIASLPIIIKLDWIKEANIADQVILHPWFLIGICVVMPLLLVSEIPLFGLKFKTFSFRENRIRYVFLALSGLMLIIFHFVSIPFILILYIILSLINNLIQKSPGK
jgi:CDP-diacylglycerol---serine O-phosphatidyltransferase